VLGGRPDDPASEGPDAALEEEFIGDSAEEGGIDSDCPLVPILVMSAAIKSEGKGRELRVKEDYEEREREKEDLTLGVAPNP